LVHWDTGLVVQGLLAHPNEEEPEFTMTQICPEEQVRPNPLGSGSQVTVPQAAVSTVQLPPAQTAWVRPPLGQLS
jgi:hypothetical protein